jgi:hypothetical protein
MRQLKLTHDDEVRQRDLSLSRLVQKSSDIMTKILQIDERKHSSKQVKRGGGANAQSLQKELITEMLKELDSEVTKLMIG